MGCGVSKVRDGVLGASLDPVVGPQDGSSNREQTKEGEQDNNHLHDPLPSLTPCQEPLVKHCCSCHHWYLHYHSLVSLVTLAHWHHWRHSLISIADQQCVDLCTAESGARESLALTQRAVLEEIDSVRAVEEECWLIRDRLMKDIMANLSFLDRELRQQLERLKYPDPNERDLSPMRKRVLYGEERGGQRISHGLLPSMDRFNTEERGGTWKRRERFRIFEGTEVEVLETAARNAIVTEEKNESDQHLAPAAVAVLVHVVHHLVSREYDHLRICNKRA